MCGILLHYHPHLNGDIDDEYAEFDESALYNKKLSCNNSSAKFNKMIPYIVDRGPNFASVRTSKAHGITWFSSVLSLRRPLCKQSIKVHDRYILQYNGELYNDDISHNDSQYIAGLLEKLPVDVVLRRLYGEFAYSIYNTKTKCIYFGRDSVGKRSLSYHQDNETGELFITSVSGKLEGFKACDAGIIYVYDTVRRTLYNDMRLREYYQVSGTHDTDVELLQSNVDLLYNKLYDSINKRLTTIEPLHEENKTHVSVLFSGGLDCSVIAALICEQWKVNSDAVLELLNVAFENPRTGMKPSEAPDRILSKRSVKILRKLYPQTKIKLVEVDVSYDDYLKHKPVVIDLMYPKDTEMDLSIAIAFYFASKGHGSLQEGDKTISYQRRSLVLFSGLGADELYGGYHKFNNKSPELLIKELTKQINNIYDRNLDRDDKCMACNGIEIRYPFLDEEVINLSTSLPINYKTNKNILRLLATNKLQLMDIGEEPKRAIQFGAKSAKMTKESSSKKGTSVITP
ncbi:putative asparagine synthase Ecym_8155 [Eremothecium cymbalariae DBVPG|uniref:Asparagine synthase (glutamine-hydrolyzing) n=1 Tax=Eremothecium cymbalariae (strain CBS 270.75 / DBVPG 7215 / KCTC 17166 / NRRL Y-17582) TaxID=931890 RepID=G8JX69_ERECY|nr:Hypothetical protein Ecym_8155 [Eremothecium cymbalariae DBVPG\